MNHDSELDPDDFEDREEAVAEVNRIRAELSEVSAAQVVVNHAMGLYELAAIHLSSHPPHLGEAKIAIDALAGVMHACESRLGEHEPTLREALAQMQIAFVQMGSISES